MDVVGWLRQNSFFDSLHPAELEKLAPEFAWRVFNAGDFVCRQGDAARSLLVVVHGRIEVFITSADGRETLVGEVGPQEFFGEIGLISGEPRSATGRAIRDTFALELSDDAYQRLLGTQQELVMRLIRLIIQRIKLQTTIQGRAQTVAVVPLVDTDVSTFYQTLQETLSKKIRVTTVDQQRLSRDVPAGLVEGAGLDPANLAVIRYLGGLEAAHDCVMYLCDPEPTPWTCRAIRQADRVLLVGSTEADPALRELEELLQPGKLRARVRRDLALQYRESLQLIGQTLHWMAPRSPDAVFSIRMDHPEDFEQLALPIVEDMSGPTWLRTSPLFASFDQHDLRSLAGELETVHLQGRQVLFEKGSPGNGLFLVVSGRLQALIVDAQGTEKILGEMGPGDIIGEIALLTGENRSATVRAIRDTKLAKLSQTAFDRLAKQRPQVVFQLARIIVERLSGRRRPNRAVRSVNFAVLPLNPRVDVDAALQSLNDGFAHLGRSLSVRASDVESRLGAGASAIDNGHPGDPTVVEWLNTLEGEFDYLLYRCDPQMTPWTLRGLRQADRIVLVAEASDVPDVTAIEQQVFEAAGIGRDIPTYLLLVQQPEALEGTGTLRWLQPRRLKQHFHVRQGSRADYSRVARLLTNRAFGLALGGGGSRGVAHVGLYRAILEAGLPIDLVSGTSAGSGIGGLIAMGDSPEAALGKVRVMMRHGLRHFLSLGPPFVAMMSGRHPNKLLNPWFADRRIEDQFIPCLITSTDLVHGKSRTHQTGLIRHAARASSSLPAAWPPVTEEGEILVDGGVLNNLPIDLIMPSCRDGFAIASDISSERDYSDYAQYGSEISGWSLLRDKFIPFRQQRKVPSMMEVISRCCTLAGAGSIQRFLNDERLLYLQLPVGEYGMFSIRDDATVNLVEQRAYEFVKEELAKWSKKMPLR